MASFSDQILTFAALLEAVVLLPILIEFIVDRRKRKHAVNLSLEVIDVAGVSAHLAGLDETLADISDLIDRARYPEAYAELQLGNEIMIAGLPLSGKKTLARRIAKEAKFDRIIIVHNPRNADALARAKHMMLRGRYRKTMLLLPRLDLIDEREDEELLVELDAVIEAVSELSHTLVVATSNHLVSGSEIDNLFGITIMLPGAPVVPMPQTPLMAEVHRMLASVAEFYIARILQAGYALADISREGFIARLLMAVSNPAQIEDIIVLCQTSAIHRQRIHKATNRQITSEILEMSIRRVVVADDMRRS
jgi:hypothetical protein